MSWKLVVHGLHSKHYCYSYFTVIFTFKLFLWSESLFAAINREISTQHFQWKKSQSESWIGKFYWMYYVLRAIRKVKHLHVETCHWGRKHCRCRRKDLQSHKRALVFKNLSIQYLLTVSHLLLFCFVLLEFVNLCILMPTGFGVIDFFRFISGFLKCPKQ